ncbi:epoxide hydrolase 1 [Hypomontagnella monticulosa]|nr:epoxide hydrolase 1 [Hypomontagnella monticulosa]
MASIRPFRISIPQSDIDDLNQKLLRSRLPRVAEDGWNRGAPIEDIRRISKHWRETFSWRSFEKRLNRLPNFKASISVDGFEPFQVHFIHQRSSVSNAIPLLFIHGWASSYHEIVKCLPLFAESEKNGGPAFHVVALSVPNCGFSSRIDMPGFGFDQYAETCHKLMLGLGYEKFACQGGDWGSTICRLLGLLYPQSIIAIHLNFIVSGPPPVTSPIKFTRFLLTHLLNWYTPAEAAGLKRAQDFNAKGNGYFQIQVQRPNTIGVALEDSPVSLLAWIYDKLVSWTDDYQWTDEEVCEWVSLYWFSRAGPAASVVLYHEAFRGNGRDVLQIAAPTVKMGFSYFPREFFSTPRFWNRQIGDVIFEKEHDSGGHFPAWEKPELFVGDLRMMFDRIRDA